MRKVPFDEMPPRASLVVCPANGTYVVVTYGEHITRGSRAGLPIVFPWLASTYAIKDGVAEVVGCTSEVGKAISQPHITKVYLCGIQSAQRTELDQLLATRGVKLAN